MNKLPAITASFWIMKICATTLGETVGDLLSMTLNVGYAVSSLLLLGVFVASLAAQLAVKRFHPLLYWTVILATSTAGTTMSDYMDRTLGLGYAMVSGILVAMLGISLLLWRWRVGTLSVNNIQTRQAEVFYWVTILLSNTLGTALGDFLADDSGLGFMGGALLILAVLLVVLVLTWATKISRIALFWIAFVLTRPFGATMGDALTKSHEKGGLDLGTIGASTLLAAALLLLIRLEVVRGRQRALSQKLHNL